MPNFDYTRYPEYYAATRDRPVHALYEIVTPLLTRPSLVLELGCGAGSGVVHWAQRGHQVTAVDLSEEALAITRERLPIGAPVALVHGSMESVELPSVDVVMAQFSLFFLPRETFEEFWPRLVGCLRPGGVFAGQFLGERDEWSDLLRLSEVEVRDLFGGFEIVHWEEVARAGVTALGNEKFWHVFHVEGKLA